MLSSLQHSTFDFRQARMSDGGFAVVATQREDHSVATSLNLGVEFTILGYISLMIELEVTLRAIPDVSATFINVKEYSEIY